MEQIIGISYKLIKIRREDRDEPLILKALNVIYLATRWFEIVQYNDKYAATISNLVYQTWLCRYPLPMIITINRKDK